MAKEQKRPLKVFLCHASGDKPAVRALYQHLVRDEVDAWLDKEKLLPGQDWQLEIPKAVRESDVVVVCLSNKSITKEGYVQKEIKFALDIASEKPEGTIFLIPARLEECGVPTQLGLWQWVDLFEPDGYERLMRSLQLRADKLGLSAGDTFYIDPELEQRLDQIYTEGLAALWVEDWDKAQHRFQAILREKPDHIQAIAKLDEAKRQKYLNALYTQALDAQKNENWQAAVETLAKLTRETADYKDVALLLKNARKKKQMLDLYEEARKLHKAGQWQAVVRVFAQIVSIDSNYRDPDGLLLSAQKEVAEIERLGKLNKLYSQGIRDMEKGDWYEARSLFEQVHKAQTGFLETERLLRKVENEISKIEELHKRTIYINTLYEQAHGLVRSQNWREALGKIEEIQKLDSQFEDKDGIAEKVKAALEFEEEKVGRQNQLAAMYAEAVRLLKEEKYQAALDKWQEVRAIDSKYSDRQHVQSVARKKLLAEINKVKKLNPKRVDHLKLYLISFAVVFVVVGLVLFGDKLASFLRSILIPTRPTVTAPALSTMTPTQTTQSGLAIAVATPTSTLQLVETITIPSTTNAGIGYKVLKTGIYVFKYSDSTSAVWNGDGIHWMTAVLAFRGSTPQWVANGLDSERALFSLGDFSYTSRAQAIDATKKEQAGVLLIEGDLITLVVADDKQYYSDNVGDIILDIFFVPH